MADFEHAVSKLLDIETGKFVSQDNGAGGCKWGITARFLRLIGIENPTPEYIQSLTREQASDLYRAYFWNWLHLGDLNSQALAEKMLFAAVNLGVGPALARLRLAVKDVGLAAESPRMRMLIGVINLLADVSPLLAAFDQRMLEFYENLAKANPALYADDLKGWKNRVKAV